MNLNAVRVSAALGLAAGAMIILGGVADAIEIDPDACLDPSAVEDCRGGPGAHCYGYEPTGKVLPNGCPEYRKVDRGPVPRPDGYEDSARSDEGR